MPKKNNNAKNQIGRTLIKSRQRAIASEHQQDSQFIDSYANLQSITQENDLDAFLRTAELADTDFTTERSLQILNALEGGANGSSGILTKDQLKKSKAQISEKKHLLKIPRRPLWNREMTAHELDRIEKESFLEWRRELAVLEEKEGMILTPFERNIEVWRQLWRVVERSDLLVQIVDARDPLFFRSVDLDEYVREVGERMGIKKDILLLINKADFLDEEQRAKWVEYFCKEEISFAFFSAKIASEVLTAEEGNMTNEEKDQEQEVREGNDEVEDEEEISSDYEINNESSDDEELEEEKEIIEGIPNTPEDTIKITEETVVTRNTANILTPLQLISLFKKLTNDKGTIGLIGYPNVGKSSTINALLEKKKVTVSSTPGKTKHFQTLLLDSIVLCDCPGLVFPSFATTKAEMIVKGVLPVDQMRSYIPPSQLVCDRIPVYYLEWMYGIKLSQDNEKLNASTLLSEYAIMRGFRTTGQGNPDESRAARHILKDYVNGLLLFCHGPPGCDEVKFSLRPYEEGGVLYEKAQEAKELGEKLHDNENSNEPVDEIFNELCGNGKEIKARVAGKGIYTDRVTSFPHQSGFNLMDDAAKKKKHKNKKRVKDRSWRAK